MNYLKTSITTYVDSFKNKTTVIALLINIVFTIITAILVTITKIISKPQMDKIDKIDLSNLVAQTEAQLQATTTTLKGFALFALSATIIFLLLFIINWSITQGTIYARLLKKKLSLKFLNRFLLLNVIWFIPWIVLLTLILFGGKVDSYLTPTLILVLLFLHFSLILYSLFAKKPRLSQIKQALKIGTIKFHHYIIPYIVITVTFIIISQINLLNLHPIIIAIIYLLFFSWTQNYLKDVTLKI